MAQNDDGSFTLPLDLVRYFKILTTQWKVLMLVTSASEKM